LAESSCTSPHRFAKNTGKRSRGKRTSGTVAGCAQNPERSQRGTATQLKCRESRAILRIRRACRALSRMKRNRSENRFAAEAAALEPRDSAFSGAQLEATVCRNPFSASAANQNAPREARACRRTFAPTLFRRAIEAFRTARLQATWKPPQPNSLS